MAAPKPKPKPAPTPKPKTLTPGQKAAATQQAAANKQFAATQASRARAGQTGKTPIVNASTGRVTGQKSLAAPKATAAPGRGYQPARPSAAAAKPGQSRPAFEGAFQSARILDQRGTNAFGQKRRK